MNRVADAIGRASDIVDRTALFLAKTALAGMVAVIGVQIVARYGLRSPPAWTEELARYLMVWAGLLGATAAFRRRLDPSVVRRETPTGKTAIAVALFTAATVILFLAPILHYSLLGPGMDPARSFMMRNIARTSSGLGLNLGFIAAAIPTFCVIILLHLAARLCGRAPDIRT